MISIRFYLYSVTGSELGLGVFCNDKDQDNF